MNTEESGKKLWNDFVKINAKYTDAPIPEIIYFGDNKTDADECAELVAKGTKQATSTSLWWLEKNGQNLRKFGDFYIITNWAAEGTA